DSGSSGCPPKTTIFRFFAGWPDPVEAGFAVAVNGAASRQSDPIQTQVFIRRPIGDSSINGSRDRLSSLRMGRDRPARAVRPPLTTSLFDAIVKGPDVGSDR